MAKLNFKVVEDKATLTSKVLVTGKDVSPDEIIKALKETFPDEMLLATIDVQPDEFSISFGLNTVDADEIRQRMTQYFFKQKLGTQEQ